MAARPEEAGLTARLEGGGGGKVHRSRVGGGQRSKWGRVGDGDKGGRGALGFFFVLFLCTGKIQVL